MPKPSRSRARRLAVWLLGLSSLSACGSGGANSAADGYPEPDVEPAGPLPVLWLTTPSVSDPDGIGASDVTGSLRVIEAHDGSLAHPEAFATMSATLETPVRVHVRGNYSATFPKKSYAVELHDSGGAQVKLPVLGMPKESDWVFYAPYPDKTYLRNVLAYWLGREIHRLPNGNIELGRWSPRTRFGELFINGHYWGLYVAIEKIKANSRRVDVDRPALDASGDLSGGYIVRREGGGDAAEGKDWVSKVERLVYTHHYPKIDDLSPAQRDYIRGYFDDFERMMRSDAWNASSGYKAWLDVASVIDYFLAMEWSNNVDGYFKSVYFLKHASAQGGKLSIEPLWDFDIAFGNADYRNGDDPKNWVYQTRGSEDADYDPPGQVPYIPAYVTRLWNDPEFRSALGCRWQKLRKGPLASASVEKKLEVWVAELGAAAARDDQRWHVIGAKLWPNPVVWKSYAEEVNYLKQFTSQRFAFLDQELGKLVTGTCD